MRESPVRLAVLTALWGRPGVAGVVLRHFAALRVPGVEIAVCAVASPEDPDPPATVPAVRYASAPNRPLSDKWNAGMAAVDRDADAVMIVGSDDLVSPAYVAEAVRLVRAGADVVRPSGLVFVDTETARARRVQPPRIGAGRVLSRHALDALGWRPWEPGRARGLDGSMDRRLREAGIPGGEAVALGFEVCDLKSAVNLWSYGAVARTGETLDAHAYLALHFPSALPLLPMAARKTKTTKTAPAEAAPAELVALRPLAPEAAGLPPGGPRIERGARFTPIGTAGDDLVHAGLAAEVA